VYGLDLISATDTAGVQTYFLYDGLGSTANLTDSGGNTTGTYSYDVFGAIRSQTGGGSNPWLFTGEQRDADPSLYYLRARYYDPTIGRFLTQDPLPLGNLYAYVGNNPVNYVDPTGLAAAEGYGFAERCFKTLPCTRGYRDGLWTICARDRAGHITVCAAERRSDGFARTRDFFADILGDDTLQWIACGTGAVGSVAAAGGTLYLASTGVGGGLLPYAYTGTTALGYATVQACGAAWED